MPIDFGAHHRMNSSGLVHASNTMRAGALKVRVVTSSRPDFRSTVGRFFMRVGSLDSIPASRSVCLPRHSRIEGQAVVLDRLQRAGETPNSRLNARPNAAIDPKPASLATFFMPRSDDARASAAR